MIRRSTAFTNPGSTLAVDFGVFGLPETFFVDRDGTVVAKITGASDSAVLAGTLDAIFAGEGSEEDRNGTGRPARQILDERYAHGEMDQDDYEQRRRLFGS